MPFYETDAMGIVHHSNAVRHLELARIVWLDEHDLPYRDYVAMGMHFATTKVEIEYRGSVRFDDELLVTVWCDHVRGASLRMGYVMHVGDVLVGVAATEHAAVDPSGRVRRIPAERRAALQKLVAPH